MIIKRESPRILEAIIHHYSVSFSVHNIEADILLDFTRFIPKQLENASLKRKAEFLVGRYCAAQALRSLGKSNSIHVGINPDRSPAWPEGIVGSITHTNNFAFAAVERRDMCRGIGIDTENIIDEESENIKHSILTEKELSLRTKTELEECAFLTLIFSAKESIFKCFNPIIKKYFGFQDVEIVKIGRVNRKFHFRLVSSLNSEFVKGFRYYGRFEISKDYIHTAVELPNSL